MRILVSDYSGHPFQVELSRALASRGHEVLHVFSESFQTPKGRLTRSEDDSPNFNVAGVRLDRPFAKGSFIKRRFQEIQIAKLIAKQLRKFRPDIVISSNAPLDVQRHLLAAAKASDAAFIFWVQDLYSEAIERILRSKNVIVGCLIGAVYRRIEARLLRQSDHIVAIADDFVSAIHDLSGVDRDRVTVIENWAPLDEISVYPRDNPWSRQNLSEHSLRIIYCGTLGLKHNPAILADLALNVNAEVWVFSEGPGADELHSLSRDPLYGNLHVRDWLPFEVLPLALASADILIVILEPDAGAFSVPSKVLTYLCAGRAILGAIPTQNRASRMISESGAGLSVEPGDTAQFVSAARQLGDDPTLRAEMGNNARAYAERAFNIDAIATRFEQAVLQAIIRKN